MKKSILFFIPKLETGGAENLIIKLANYLSKKNYDISVITITKGKHRFDLLNDNIKIIELNYSRTLFSFFKIINIIYNYKNVIIFSILRHLNILILFANFFLLLKKKIFIIEVSLLKNHLKYNKKFIYYFFYSFLTLISYPFANKIIVPSKLSTKILQKKFLLKKKIVHIYNPINIKKIIELSNTKIIPKILEQNKHNRIIVSIGRLTWEKDYITLINSFHQVTEKIDNVILIILGEGQNKDYLKDFIDKKNLQNKIFLLGNVDNPYVYLKYSDLYVLSSVSELFPTSLIESLVFNINILSTNCDYGPTEILENGKWGYLVPVKNIKLMTQSIIDLISNKNNNNKNLDRAHDFDLEVSMKNYISLIEDKYE
tara:strand:+ start:17777 stop:18889 length:1113 start_codon:yes stop_codon:yes gene_type:complete